MTQKPDKINYPDKNPPCGNCHEDHEGRTLCRENWWKPDRLDWDSRILKSKIFCAVSRIIGIAQQDKAIEGIYAEDFEKCREELHQLFTEQKSEMIEKAEEEIKKLYWCEEHKTECDHINPSLDDILDLLDKLNKLT